MFASFDAGPLVTSAPRPLSGLASQSPVRDMSSMILFRGLTGNEITKVSDDYHGKGLGLFRVTLRLKSTLRTRLATRDALIDLDKFPTVEKPLLAATSYHYTP